MCDSNKIFICPYNPYHKLMEFRKWQFHVTRCGDRKGKTVYQCQYQPSHMFCDISSLVDHEENQCEFRHTQKMKYDNSDPETAKNRIPQAVYCKYDVGHVFGSVEECNEHMSECPKKEEFERKAEQCHRKFTQNKQWIKAAQQAKKQKEQELGGNINAPASMQMPNLRYQYVMNEPFVGGINATVQSSLEANVHKRYVAYDLDIEEDRREQHMSLDERKEALKQELCTKIDQDIKEQGQSISTDDVDTLLIKHDQEVEFGLKIIDRKDQKLTLFEFNVEKQINLKKFIDITQLDTSDIQQVREFLYSNMLLKLEVVKIDEVDFMTEKDSQIQKWRERSLEVLDDYQMKLSMNCADQAVSIYMNTIQGRKLNCCISKDLNYHNIFLFLITKETEVLGPILSRELKCDFMVIKFETPFSHEMKPDMDGFNDNAQMNDLEAYALQREVKQPWFDQVKTQQQSPLNEEQIRVLKEEITDYQQQLKETQDMLKATNIDLDTANKSIYDKERQGKADKRDIQYVETQLRNTKTKLQEVIEQLTRKETEYTNAEKEKDNLNAEIKKHELRFEKQKKRTEEFQGRYNETQLKLAKAQELLTGANKIVKHKDNVVINQDMKIEAMEKIIKQYTDGTNDLSYVSVNSRANTNGFVYQGDKGEDPYNVKNQLSQDSMQNNSQNDTVQQKVVPKNPGGLVDGTGEDLDTGTDDHKFEEETGLEDAEIIDDEEDLDQIQRNKAQFQYNQMQHDHGTKMKRTAETPSASAVASKAKNYDVSEKQQQNPEDTQSEQNSAVQTKIKPADLDIEREGIEKLKEHLLCVSCCTKPKCMLIQTCKHVPFCKDCDNNWKMQSAKTNQALQCPICRKDYKKTMMIQFI